MGMTGEPDLISRATAGEKVAFEALLEPVVASAARLAYAMLQDRTEAEDVVQEAAVKAWRKLGTFRPGADSNRGSWPSSPSSAGTISGARVQAFVDYLDRLAQAQAAPNDHGAT